MTKAEVRSMMEDADYNGDGKLDYYEVIFTFSFAITSNIVFLIPLSSRFKIHHSTLGARASKLEGN